MTDHFDEAVTRVISGQNPRDVLEGLLQRRSLVTSKSRSSLTTGGTPVRKASVSRDAGWTYTIAAEGPDDQEVAEIVKAVVRRGALELIPPTSDFPVAHITSTAEGFQIVVLDPPDLAMNLPLDPEIRMAQRRLGSNPTNRSELRRFVHLLVTKVRYTSPLGAGLTAA